MLTGRPPFTGTVRQVLVAHATESPQPVTELRDDVPEPLAALIMRCLEKEPTERPQTAAAVRDALDMMLTQKEVNGPPSLGMQAPRTRRFRPLVGAALSAAALGTAIGVQVYTERQDLDPHRVIVAAFQNESGDPQLEQLGTMTTDWITRGLTETGLADPIPATPTRDASGQIVPGELELKSLARQARALGGRHIVAGAIYATGDSFQVHARIADAVDGKILVSVPPAVGSKIDPMLAINTMRTSVLGALAAMSPWEGFGVVSSDAPPSYAAYREFLRGEEAFSRGDFQAAIEHDRRAIALDSTYLAPLVRIAYAFINIGQCAQTDSVGRLVNAKRDQLPAYEGYYLDRVLAWCRGDLNAAYLAAKRMVAVAPHSSYAKYISARSALPINRPHEALDALERLDWRKPHISGYYTDLTGALHKLGKYEHELEVARLYRERHSGSLLPAEAYVRALSALGRVEEVRRATAASLAMSSIEWVSGPATVSLTASRELAAHGHPDAGRRIAQELVEWLRQRDPTTENDSLLVKALLSARQFAAAYSEARPLVAAHPENVRYLTFIGVSAAGMDDRVEAQRVSDALGQLKQPNVGGATIYGQAAIAARLGERARAVTLLREAIRKGYTDALQDHADLNFLSLHGYPPYEELVKPRG
jgi:tetratricopeptide (TPR) repeat protein/TolB-like protein